MKKTLIVATAVIGLSGSTLFGQPIESEAATTKHISSSQAKELALNVVNGKIVDFEYENDKRNPHYEIEIKTTKEKIELKVDALNGYVKITDREPIKNKAFHKHGKAKGHSKFISQTKAAEIAKAHMNGQGYVSDIEMENDDHLRFYKITFIHNNVEYEYKIHAKTGKILKIEVED